DAAATGQARIVLPWIVGVGGDNAAERLTFGYVELVTRTYDDCPGAKLAGAQIFDLNSGAAFSLSRYDLKRFCVDIDAVIVGYCQDGLCVSGCKRGDADGRAHDYRCCTLPHGTDLLCGDSKHHLVNSRRAHSIAGRARAIDCVKPERLTQAARSGARVVCKPGVLAAIAPAAARGARFRQWPSGRPPESRRRARDRFVPAPGCVGPSAPR